MFWSFDERSAELRELCGDLARLKDTINFEQFRSELEAVRRRERKDNSGRKPFDVVLMFKILVLQSLYNLSDEQAEYQIKDRISFMNFLGLTLSDTVPDQKTIWLFRDQLRQAGLEKKLFKHFELFLRERGVQARKGQIVDASIVDVPKQRMTPEQREALKRGEVPPEFQKPAQRLAQKDFDARWTRKCGESRYGYKNHIVIDTEHKLIRGYEVTDAATHDGHLLHQLLTDNTSRDVYADSAYRACGNEAFLQDKGYRNHLNRQGRRGKPLNARQVTANQWRKRIRVRVEHVFGRIVQPQRQTILHVVGLARAKIKIGLMNLVYNFRQYTLLATR